MHPFCCRAVPFSKDSEEKHCRPKQRWIPLHENPSHTHSTSPVLPLSAEHTHTRKTFPIYLQLWDAKPRNMVISLSSTMVTFMSQRLIIKTNIQNNVKICYMMVKLRKSFTIPFTIFATFLHFLCILCMYPHHHHHHHPNSAAGYMILICNLDEPATEK